MIGFFPVPGQTLYGASKASVKLLTEGLYSELLETNVRVTVVFPGAIATNVTQNSGVSIKSDGASSRSFPTTAPEKAAETIVNGMERDQYRKRLEDDESSLSDESQVCDALHVQSNEIAASEVESMWAATSATAHIPNLPTESCRSQSALCSYCTTPIVSMMLA